MSKHVLSICKLCNAVHAKEVDYEKSEGAMLLKQVENLKQNWSRADELEVRSVNCMLMCDHHCVVAFSAADKPTYLFTKIPSSAGDVLLEFGELYLNSKTGDIPLRQFPESLQTDGDGVAKIPPISGRAHRAE